MNDHKRALEAQLRRDGGKLADFPDGPSLDAFEPMAVAQAIEHELNRSAHPKLRLELDRDDALKFAAFLRRACILGA